MRLIERFDARAEKMNAWAARREQESLSFREVMSGTREIMSEIKTDIATRGDRTAAAEKLSDKKMKRAMRRTPKAEWLYTEVVKSELELLLAAGWEIADSTPKTFLRSGAWLLRIRNPNAGA